MKDNATSIRHSSHRKEDKSKRAFEELIDPWYVQGWTSRDYGIDTVVEITSQIGETENFRTESKYFFVQLKSTERPKFSKETITIQVPSKKVIQWFSSNVPVIFVLTDLNKNIFYYLWIDELLISNLETANPNWINQKTITLKLPLANIFNRESKEFIRYYVTNWRSPSRKILAPGKYFELKESATRIIETYKSLSTPFQFESVNKSIEVLSKDIEQAIYRIAITGPSRVGKSSLINALLNKDNREISPTGFFQTTGVPIKILPGKDEQVIISFQNGKDIKEKYSSDTIKQYASQEYNIDNSKKVRSVSIVLSNPSLEKGVSLFDIPGLNDPDDNIIDFAWQAVKQSNAILYVIDASPAENGGFIFSNDYKKHILDLGQSLDKIFLVFNKVEVLSPEKLERLKNKVHQDLVKLNLYDKVFDKIYYVSAERREGKDGIDSIEKLQEDIWAFLLKENKFGIVRLNLINLEIEKSIQNLESILRARLIDQEKRDRLQGAIKSVESKIPTLAQKYQQEKSRIRQHIYNSLDNRKNNLLSQLEKTLTNVSLDKSLPGNKWMKSFLSHGAFQAIENCNLEYANLINNLKEVIDSWIEDNLKQVREIITENNSQRIVNLDDLENFKAPDIDLSSAWGMGFLGLLAGVIINPPAAIISGIIGFFGSLLMSAESRRAKQILKTMEAARKTYDSTFSEIKKKAYSEALEGHAATIAQYTNEKVGLFFNDLKKQVGKLNAPISSSEMKIYTAAFEEIESLQRQVKLYRSELEKHYTAL